MKKVCVSADNFLTIWKSKKWRFLTSSFDLKKGDKIKVIMKDNNNYFMICECLTDAVEIRENEKHVVLMVAELWRNGSLFFSGKGGLF